MPLTCVCRFMDNQLSPLLRLPTEIRNTIWMHVLGGKTYRAMGFSGREVSQTYKFAPSAAEPRNGMALLRTCRQIYSETALYPMKSATFTYGHIVYLKRSIKSLKPYQRRQITHLQMECICYGNMITSCRQEVYQFNRHVRKKLPASTSMTVLFSETNIVAADIPQYVHPANEITDVTLSVMTTSSVLDPYYI